MTGPVPPPAPADTGAAVQPESDVKPGARPPSNAGWAVVSLLVFWPLAFSAFNHAFDVYPRWASGDAAGARYASGRVRWLGQLSLWIAGALFVLLAVLYAVAVIVFVVHGGDESGWHGGARGRH